MIDCQTRRGSKMIDCRQYVGRFIQMDSFGVWRGKKRRFGYFKGRGERSRVGPSRWCVYLRIGRWNAQRSGFCRSIYKDCCKNGMNARSKPWPRWWASYCLLSIVVCWGGLVNIVSFWRKDWVCFTGCQKTAIKIDINTNINSKWELNIATANMTKWIYDSALSDDLSSLGSSDDDFVKGGIRKSELISLASIYHL